MQKLRDATSNKLSSCGGALFAAALATDTATAVLAAARA